MYLALGACQSETGVGLPVPRDTATKKIAPCVSQLATDPQARAVAILACLAESSQTQWDPLIARGLRATREGSLHRAYFEHYAALRAQNRGEYGAALALGRSAGSVFASDDGALPWLAASLHNRGVLEAALGRGREALTNLEAALAIRRQLGDHEGAAAVLTQIGWVFFLMKDSDAAILKLQEALALRTQPYGRAATLDRLGSAYRAVGRYREAAVTYREALEVFEQLDDPLRGHVLANLGWLSIDSDRLEAAESQLRLSLPLLRHVGDLGAEAHVLVGLADIEARRGRLEEALGYLETALLIIERLRHNAPLFPAQSTFLALRGSYFTRHVDLLIRLHRKFPHYGYDRRAFLAEERRRARALLDLLIMGPRIGSSGEPERRELSQNLRARITAGEAELRRGKSGDQARDLKDRLRNDLTEYAFLHSVLRDTRGALPTHSATLVEVAGTQRLLDADTSVLTYSLGDERSYLFLVDATTFEIFKLPPRQEIERIANDYHDLVTVSDELLAADQARVVGGSLMRAVLSPVAGRLKGRVIVMPDGALHHIPFATLPDPDGSGRLMLESRVLTTAPSVSVLAALGRIPRREWQHDVVLVAPDGAPEDARIRNPALPRLRGVLAEIEAITDLIPRHRVLHLLGRDATRGRLGQVESGSYRVLHIASHAYISTDFPELSAILLSDGAGGEDTLQLQEIFALSLPTDLVVLSACDSALGELLQGEGMLGMSHAFLSTGARNVIASLWKVDDEATAALMERFYRYLMQDQDEPANALRRAQLDMLADSKWRAPVFWAAFEHFGR